MISISLRLFNNNDLLDLLNTVILFDHFSLKDISDTYQGFRHLDLLNTIRVV